MRKRKAKLRLYRGRDGWRYTLRRNGRIADAATQGYERRDAAVENMMAKWAAYRNLGPHLDDLLRKRGTVVEIEL